MRQLETVLSRLVPASRPALGSGSLANEHDGSVASPSSATLANRGSIPTSSSPFSPRIDLADGGRRGVSTPRRRSNNGIPTASSLPLRAQLGSETLEFSSATQIYPPSVHFDRLVREGSLPQDEIRNLASALPSQPHTSALLDVFSRDINPLFFPFDETWFREAVNADVLWGDLDHPTYARDAPDHISFLSQPRSFGTEADGAAQAARMSFQCRKCHMLATSIQCHDPFLVLSYVLLARFLILQRQAKESWLSFATAIREAEILGLHRLGPAPDEQSRTESTEAAMRRRIWSHLYFESSFHSLIIGQTPLIHDAFCDTAPPEPPNADPWHFDLAAIIRIRYDLSRIVGKALHLLLSDHHDMHADAIFRLDHELQAFRHSLPLPYRMDDASLSHPHHATDDDSFRKIALHRFVLHSSICFVLISLHLPHLRRGNAEPGFERSRQAAIQAAVADSQSRQELRQQLDWPDHLATDRFVGGRFSYFHATSTLGICLLSEPDLERVHQLVSLLDEFLDFAQHHQRQQGVDPNRCIRQEFGIVSLIRARINRKLDAARPKRRAHDENIASPSPSLITSSQRRHIPAPATEPSTAPIAVEPAQQTTATPTMASLLPPDPDPQNANAELMQTGHPELGEDMYDWWSWLVSSLQPSDSTSGLTTDQHT
ncbi:uncharacterized protein SRS1_16121 [Sporisorium reilianum f. sp. reilianum]|uniref:Xylanolytic transcriptional activator regulatory domain-containing protein n=1 Tax=Sporisorium reilianum f. sp. reilianum TaxID=72559 RepID=A0A2N8UKJ0_9BASI|nr:uncharacterized protein SRS1_16121 [Sporisorium reilianum f. sp. reilianum]